MWGQMGGELSLQRWAACFMSNLACCNQSRRQAEFPMLGVEVLRFPSSIHPPGFTGVELGLPAKGGDQELLDGWSRIVTPRLHHDEHASRYD